MRYITKISMELREIAEELNSNNILQLKIVSRKLAKAEMDLQACRSLLESRLFQAEIDNMEAPDTTESCEVGK